MTNFIENRDLRLANINATLSERGLKVMPKLGDNTKGEVEIRFIAAIFDDNKQFFTDVTFAVSFPGGKEGSFKVRFNANGEICDGAVIVVMVNGRFAVVKQWRLPLGRWTYEVARGFSDKLDAAHKTGDLAALSLADLPASVNTALRNIHEEVAQNAKVKGIFHLGDIAENSGTHAVAPSYFLVQIEVPADKLADAFGGSDNNKVTLWDADQVADEIGGKLADCHTITAFALARKKLARTLVRL
jgi:hypothetical protein